MSPCMYAIETRLLMTLPQEAEATAVGLNILYIYIYIHDRPNRYILLSSPIHCTHITDHHAPLGTVLPLRSKSNSCAQTYKHTGHSP